MDIDHIFNNQFELDEHCMALPEARTLMARHLEGEDIGVRLHEVRRVLKKNNVFPIGALGTKRMVEDISTYGVDNAKRQKGAAERTERTERSSPAAKEKKMAYGPEFYRTFHTAPEWIESFTANLSETNAILFDHVDKVRNEMFKGNVAQFGDAVAVAIENQIYAVGSAFGKAFDVKVPGAKRSDDMIKALLAMDRIQLEIAHHVLDEQELASYFQKQEEETIQFYAQHIVHSFQNGSADDLVDRQFSEQAPDIGMMIKAGIREQQAARAAKLGIQYNTIARVQKEVDALGAYARKAGDMTNAPTLWNKLIDAVFKLIGATNRWVTSVSHVFDNEDAKGDEGDEEDEEDAEGDEEDEGEGDERADVEGKGKGEDIAMSKTKKKYSISSWVIHCLKFLMGMALVATPLYVFYVDVRSKITPDAYLEEARKQIKAIQEEDAAALSLDEGGIEMLEEQLSKTEKIQTALSDKMTVYETQQYINEHLPNGTAAMTEGLLPQLKNLQGDVTEMFAEVEKVTLADYQLFKDNPNIDELQKQQDAEEILRIQRLKEEYEQEMDQENPNVDSVLRFMTKISRRYFGASAPTMLKNIKSDTADLLAAVKLFAEKHVQFKKTVENGSTRLKMAFDNLKTAQQAYENTKNETPVYTSLMNWVAKSDLAGTLPIPIGSSFTNLIGSLGLNRLRDMEAAINHLLKDATNILTGADSSIGVQIVGLLVMAGSFLQQWAFLLGYVSTAVRLFKNIYITAIHMALKGAHEVMYHLYNWVFGKSCAGQEDSKKCREENRAAFERHGGWFLTFLDDGVTVFGGSPIPLTKMGRYTQALTTAYSAYNIATTVWPMLSVIGSAIVLAGIPGVIGASLAVGAFAFVMVRVKGHSIVNQLTNWFITHPFCSSVVIFGVQALIVWIIKRFGYADYVQYTYQPVDEKADKILEDGGLGNAFVAYRIVKQDPDVKAVLDAANALKKGTT